MGDLDYQSYQNTALSMAGQAKESTLAQYADVLNDPKQLGQHVLADTSQFLLHDKLAAGVREAGNAFSFSEADVRGVLGQLGDGVSSAGGALGKLSKDIKGAINDRFGDYSRFFKGHTSPQNAAMRTEQNLTSFESSARIPGARTYGLLPGEVERPDDEFSNPVNPNAPRSSGASNPQAEEESTQRQEGAAPNQEDVPKTEEEDTAPPPRTSGEDMANAPNPSNDTSAADAANARNQAEQDGKKITRSVEEDDADVTEADPELAPLTAIVGVAALVGSFFIHPHQKIQTAAARAGTNISTQIGA